MFTREVVANQGAVMASRFSRLESRRKACEEINKMFGLDIWCDFREDDAARELQEDETYQSNFDDEGVNNIQV
jgi:hypothetical protein